MYRIASEIEKWMKQLVNQNLIKAINCIVIPVASYLMNVCKFMITDLDKLDKVNKKVLCESNMHGRQSSDERLYLNREKGGRDLKTMNYVYEETKVRIACYMAHSNDEWMKVEREREYNKEGP